MENLPLSGDLAVLIAALLAGGLITGLLAGLFGIGGGGIAVIVLFELFTFLDVPIEVRMHCAIGTALAVMTPTAIRSFMAHRAKGAVDMDLIRSMAVFVVIGVIGGSVLARYAPGDVMKAAWVCIAPIMAARLFAGRTDWVLGPDVPRGLFRAIYGTILGFVSTIMSIGGGVFVSAMMVFYSRPIHQAIGTSSGFGPIIGIPAVIGFIWAGWGVEGRPDLSLGYVNLPGGAIVAVASILAAPVGVKIAHRFSRRKLEIAFGCLLTFMAGRFLVSILAS